jgi:hypothetical protein
MRMNVVTLVEAIAREEGFYVRGTRAQRNFNPGDLEFGNFAAHHGATGSDGRFAIFPDAATGFAALRELLMTDYAGMTLVAALNRFAPPFENDTTRYLENVLLMTGLVADTILTDKLLGI